MIDKQRIRDLMARLGAHEPPVLSLYLDVDATQRASGPRGIMVQVKSALGELAELPGEVAEQVLAGLEHEVPPARMLAVFAGTGAGAGQGFVEVFASPVPVPLNATPGRRALARWGAPYLLPLLAALDPHPSYAAVFVDREHWRCFHIVRGTIEEIAHDMRTLSPAEYDEMKRSKPEFPAYVPTRGSAAKDLADRHVAELSRRFYTEIAQRLQELMSQRGIESLITLGPQRDVARLEDALPLPVAGAIAARLPSLPNPRASASEVIKHVTPTLERLDAEREEALLTEVRERGVAGLDACLSELQRGRVLTLVVPSSLEGSVFREQHTGFVSTTDSGARCYRPEDPDVRELPLALVLPALACEYNTRIALVHGPNRDRLERELGGLGALVRWR